MTTGPGLHGLFTPSVFFFTLDLASVGYLSEVVRLTEGGCRLRARSAVASTVTRSPVKTSNEGARYRRTELRGWPANDVARFLSHHPPFDALPRDELQHVAEAVAERTWRPGEVVLVQDGPPARYLFVVRDGSFDLEQRDRRRRHGERRDVRPRDTPYAARAGVHGARPRGGDTLPRPTSRGPRAARHAGGGHLSSPTRLRDRRVAHERARGHARTCAACRDVALIRRAARLLRTGHDRCARRRSS